MNAAVPNNGHPRNPMTPMTPPINSRVLWLSRAVLALLLAPLALVLVPPAQAAPTVTTTTTLTTAVTTVQVGVPVLLTASVTGTAPTGTVTFKRGTTTMGTGTLSGTGNTRTATYSATFTTVATNSLTAVYGADAVNKTSTSSAKSVSSTKRVTTTSVASSLNPSTSGASVTFTATVVGYNPAGTVTFKRGTTTLGTGTLSGTGNTRSATYVKSNLTVASHNITAVYAGNTLNLTSTSSALSQVVNPVQTATTTALTSNANPATFGNSITLTATVSGSTPGGTVTFKDGAATIGTGTLTAGVATLATTTLTVGSHSLSAVYAGDTNNSTSTSSVLTQTINAATVASTTNLSVNPNPASVGASVTLTATVTGNTPTGTVTFQDGSTTIGTGSISAGVASFTTSSLAVGGHSLTASYAGDAGNLTSTSGAVLFSVNAAGPGVMTWQYGYDAMGRPTSTLDPNGLSTYTYYDSLGRPIQTQQPANVGAATPTTTDLTYNLADSLTSVTDPRSLATTYTPNGLGSVTAQSSPDSGAAQFTYDAKGNVLTATDARGKVTTMTYDVLDRPTSVSYPTGVATVLEYDGGPSPTPAARGELTKVTDESGSTTYTYDALGRLSTKTQLTSGRTFTVGYTWGDSGPALDKLTAITYPSGNRVNYSYDAQGSLAGVSLNPVNPNGVGVSGTSQSLLSSLTYNADSNVTGWTWSSGQARSIGYNSFGLVSGYSLGNPSGTGAASGAQRTVVRDAAGRITGYSHTNNAVPAPALDQSFGYDNLNRLLNATLAGTTTQYSYDASGNRTAKAVGATTYTSTVSPTSNRLVQTQDVGGTVSYVYDAAGNVTGDGTNTFTYSDRGRMATASNAGGTVNYLYNAMSLRVAKTGPTALIPSGAAYFVYDESGQLLGEYDANNNPIYETIYLNATPVGVIKQTGTAAGSNIATSLYNVHADHIQTARVITRASDNAIVWRWDTAEAFGATAADQNPNALGTFVYNQRFPGQVFDSETGLLQNWHREYNPRQGRYAQSDPIGLAGGINTFSYVGGDPIRFVDPTGEIVFAPWVVGGIVGGISGGVGGYMTSGTWKGAWQGAAVGGFIGAINPFASTLGAYTAGVAANAAGQAIGNYEACQPLGNINVELALLSSGAGMGGRALAMHAANPRRSASAYLLTQRMGSSQGLNIYGGAVIEGSVGGFVELGLNSIRNDIPSNSCTCRAHP